MNHSLLLLTETILRSTSKVPEVQSSKQFRTTTFKSFKGTERSWGSNVSLRTGFWRSRRNWRSTQALHGKVKNIFFCKYVLSLVIEFITYNYHEKDCYIFWKIEGREGKLKGRRQRWKEGTKDLLSLFEDKSMGGHQSVGKPCPSMGCCAMGFFILLSIFSYNIKRKKF